MKDINAKSKSDNIKHLSAIKSDVSYENKSIDGEILDRNDVENILPCKVERVDVEGSDVECIEENRGSGRLLDYIILDDDDDDDNKPNGSQLSAEIQLKRELLEEVRIKKELLCSSMEDGISSSETQPEDNKETDKEMNVVVDELEKEAVKDTDVTTPKEEGGNEKNGDSLVLTLDEKELGEISETVESKSGSNEIQTEPMEEVNEKEGVSKETEIVDKPETKSIDVIESNDKTDNNQKVKGSIVNEPIPKSRVVWVTNLKRSTKATDLKQHLNKFGKVITTKIVTDGRRCFGYVVLESCTDAANCINNLNDSEYEGTKITITTNKPMVESKGNHKEDENIKSKANEDNENKKKQQRTRSRERKEQKEKSKSKATSKRRRSPFIDPLTTKFDNKSSSRDKDERIEREYLREKQEKERLRRRLVEEMKRSRDEMSRLREKEAKQRQMELKLQLERKKLNLEKEMLERERREFMQLEEEKRRIEKEKINLMRQKLEIENSIRESKRKVTPERVERKIKKRRVEVSNFNNGKFDIERRRRSSERKDNVRYPNIRKSKEKKQTSSYYRDTISKIPRHNKNMKHQSRRDEKNFSCVPPPPPKLGSEFGIPKRKQMSDSLRSYNRKSSSSPSASKQTYHSYRKIDIDKPKILQQPRREERANVGKSADHYGHSGKDQRIPWNSTIPNQWKMVGMEGQSGTGFSVNRYPEISNYSSSNYTTPRFPQPTFYSSQPISLPPPNYKFYFDHHPSNRKY